MTDYRVEVYQRAASTNRGRVNDVQIERLAEVSTPDWQWCLDLIHSYARTHPEHIVAAYNAARAEPDTDGLSDEERDEMLRVVEQAQVSCG